MDKSTVLLLAEGINIITAVTDCDHEDVVQALVGNVIDEEGAGQLQRYFKGKDYA